jgi:hypothetical protein
LEIWDLILIILFLISISISILCLLFVLKLKNEKNKLNGLIEIFQILTNIENREARRQTFEAFREKKIDYSGKILDLSYESSIENVRANLDLIGLMTKQGYVSKDSCLKLCCGIIIRSWKSLEKNILFERKRLGANYKEDFEWLAEEALKFWKKNYSNIPEPEIY